MIILSQAMDGYLLFCVGVVNESTEAKDFVAYVPPILGPRWMQGKRVLGFGT